MVWLVLRLDVPQARNTCREDLMTREQQAPNYPTGVHVSVERNSRGVTWKVTVDDPDDEKAGIRLNAWTGTMERKYGKLVTEVE
jgi:hypothetical protein